ncbi:hypothetical protein JH146_0685 [Methanocaldococcus bathoardescens]|uniref:Uncharacterized protein n=1 Tax=Methanocaldococcus bathoardescens TaxID=1301915 RepID=A0A076LJ28_9EURY|nr:hypothetical protein [Methanocaldococcus bathoardescens]AIJ05534.1 hypothetical protein JH146_0685 [Methanocaldococcus bathoardescens]
MRVPIHYSNINISIYTILILTAFLGLMSESFAETNAYNITIKNASSGEVLYHKIIPKGKQFYDNKTNGNVHIIINYTPPSNPDTNAGYAHTYKTSDGNIIVNVSIEGDSFNYKSTSYGIYLKITPITYDFSSPSSSPSSTKAPIPLNVYLITTAFFTYILYRKSKNLT